MTRKDYVLLARIISRARVTKDGKETSTLDGQYFVEQLCNALKEDNSRFNMGRFSTAYGIHVE